MRRYALYCGEPVLTGFMRLRPGPRFWATFFLLLNIGAMIPGLASHAGAVLASLWLGRPANEADRASSMGLAYACLVQSSCPCSSAVEFTTRSSISCQPRFSASWDSVLSWPLIFVGPRRRWAILSGFAKFGTVPVVDAKGHETAVNAFTHYAEHGAWPVVSLANIAVLGAFAGYAGGGGLGNSLYSNFVRDKGWGMGRHVGAIPSAIGGATSRSAISASVFPSTTKISANGKAGGSIYWSTRFMSGRLGCFVGMALPALMSSNSRPIRRCIATRSWSGEKPSISADGLRHLPGLAPTAVHSWTAMLLVGLLVLLPSQLSVVDEVSRRWTDVVWSANRRVARAWSTTRCAHLLFNPLGVRRLERHQSLSVHSLWNAEIDDDGDRQYREHLARLHGVPGLAFEPHAFASRVASALVSSTRDGRVRRVLPRHGGPRVHQRPVAGDPGMAWNLIVSSAEGAIVNDERHEQKCFYASPEYSASFWGKNIWLYQGKGTLRLTAHSLRLDTGPGSLEIPFHQIKSIGLGRFSVWAKPGGLDYLTVARRTGRRTQGDQSGPLRVRLGPHVEHVQTCRALVRETERC